MYWISAVVGVKRVVCWSGGSDSTATVIIAKEKGIPIDCILFSEVMFDAHTSCELPEHMEFVKNVAIPRFAEWGYETKILHHDKTYMDYFNQYRIKGKYVGKKVGFPMADKCNVRNCKVQPIEKFLKTHKDCIQYVGICADEPLRLCRLGENKYSLLAQYEYGKEKTMHLCKEYQLLSPYYQYSKRGGCWCCPNASITQLRFLRERHPELWKKLLLLEEEEDLIGNIFNTQAGRSVKKLEEDFLWESRQLDIVSYSESYVV